MNTKLLTHGMVCLATIALLVMGSVAHAQLTSEWGVPTGMIISARNAQILYTSYAQPAGGLWLHNPNLVLVIDGVNVDNATQTITMSFTGYNHMGNPRPIFWVRRYAGDLVWVGGGLGTLTYRFHYIGGRPYPLSRPESIAVRFVPR